MAFSLPMADALDLNFGSCVVFGYRENAALTSRKKVCPRQKIACDGLNVASPQSAPGGELMFVRNVHGPREQGTGDRLQGWL